MGTITEITREVLDIDAQGSAAARFGVRLVRNEVSSRRQLSRHGVNEGSDPMQRVLCYLTRYSHARYSSARLSIVPGTRIEGHVCSAPIEAGDFCPTVRICAASVRVRLICPMLRPTSLPLCTYPLTCGRTSDSVTSIRRFRI